MWKQCALFTGTKFSCSCFNPKLLNVSRLQSYNSGWTSAVATWYGSANSDGTNGGACGYQSAVGQPPYSDLVSAGGPSLFDSGLGCGACYQVKCTVNAACSGNPVTVTLADSCPGCTDAAFHFDLSGTAFGAMAISGLATQLLDAGTFPILFQRVLCNYPGFSVTFVVDSGSNSYYFAVVIEFQDGDGNLSAVALQQANSNTWTSMQHSWGAVWELDTGAYLQAPFSIQLTGDSGSTLVASNVIPVGWQPGQTYQSTVNFNV
ncbi:hypothetical protein Vadar_023994 [Vaccinium darrowii]|uniref:Uncharacterized protein n=1 Tax=Vaccinium darrowii TaxID=229202 RepID=A0ACB7ZEV7_9ERIC|nr:hypothetical protein Vadar_023994 [Vaccinium darrowii]